MYGMVWYVYTLMYVCMYVYFNTYSTYVCMYVCMHTFICMHVCLRVYVYMYDECIVRVPTYVCVCIIIYTVDEPFPLLCMVWYVYYNMYYVNMMLEQQMDTL